MVNLRTLILGAIAGLLAGILLAASWGCSTPSGHYPASDPAWIFARGQLDRQTVLLERIAAALEKQREVVTPNLGGPYYPNPIPWAWPTNKFTPLPYTPLPYQWAPTSSWRIVTNYCIGPVGGLVK
jgi:hypothetical protein